MYSNVFVQAGNQDSAQPSLQPDAEVTMGMDDDDDDEGIVTNTNNYCIRSTSRTIAI